MDYNCHNAAVSELILQKVFEVTFVCTNTTTESVMPLFDRLIHNALLEFSPRHNQTLPQPQYTGEVGNLLLSGVKFHEDIVYYRNHRNRMVFDGVIQTTICGLF